MATPSSLRLVPFGLLSLLACSVPVTNKGRPGDTATVEVDSGSTPIDTDWADTGSADTGAVDTAPAEEDPCAACYVADPAFVAHIDYDCDGDTLSNEVETNKAYYDADGGEHYTNICLQDSDGDTLNDNIESAYLCEIPTSPDSDNDGLSDGDERAFMTSSCSQDSDDDGLWDGVDDEPSATLGDSDVDRDGLIYSVEISLGTDPNAYDSDDDCMSDGDEVSWSDLLGDIDGVELSPIDIDSDHDGLIDGREANKSVDSDPLLDGDCTGFTYLETDPRLPDSDADDLSDGDEVDSGAYTATDPLNPDSDFDELSDGDERVWGTQPDVQDTDSDGINDGPEVELALVPPTWGDLTKLKPLLPTATDSDGDTLADGDELDCTHTTHSCTSSPFYKDSDGDTLHDGREVAGTGTGTATCYRTAAECMSDPMVTDTDGDGLDDLEERAAKTHSDDVDSDGDGLTDGDEVSWGAASGASVPHYANDAAYPDALTGVNEELQCSSVADDPSGTTFVDAMTDSGSTYPEEDAAGYYTTYKSGNVVRDGFAYECVCNLEFNDVRPESVTGLTVRLETLAHTASVSFPSKWTTNQTPAGVAFYAPWLQITPASGEVYSLIGDNAEVTALGAERWYAFGSNASDMDTSYLNFSTASDVVISRIGGTTTGTHATTQVVVSRANAEGDDIAYCEHLMGQKGSGYTLKATIDSITAHAALAATCDSGEEGTTRYLLTKAAGPARLLAVGGAAAHEGASPLQIDVTRWQGVALLRGRDVKGRSVVLRPAAPSVRLSPNAFQLHGATWEAQGPSGEPLFAPVELSIRHTCPTTTAATTAAVPTLSVSWTHLNTWLGDALGLPLSTLVAVDMPLDTAAFRLRIEPARTGQGKELVIEAPGGGELDRLPLQAQSERLWSFDIRRPKLQLRGGLYLLNNGDYELRVTRGEVGEPGQALRIRPFQGVIPMAPAASVD